MFLTPVSTRQVKKWNNPVGEVGSKFLSKVKKSKSKIGYFISKEEFSFDFKKEINQLKKEGVTIFVFDTEGIVNLHNEKIQTV